MAKRPRHRATPKPTRPPKRPAAAARRETDRPALLIVLATNLTHMEEAVAVLIDMGIAATVIQTRPLTSVLREEIPVFAGLASMLPRMPESRLLVSITTTALADRALKMLASATAPSHQGLFGATIALRGFIGTLAKP